jgi:hypothetical protein
MNMIDMLLLKPVELATAVDTCISRVQKSAIVDHLDYMTMVHVTVGNDIVLPPSSLPQMG